MSEDNKTVRILYTNYRDETAMRSIVPDRIHFASTEWHTDPQWLLDAFDLERNAMRSFALKDIRAWLVGQ